MLVTFVLGDCPGCGGKQQFGNVAVQGDRILRGCKCCKYHITIPLPKIRKKILYLDQFFFSNAFKMQDPRFVDVAHRIREISAQQLLVVPFSSIHEDETHLWSGYAGKNKYELMEFIKSTSRGHQFEPSYHVEELQIVKAFKAYLDNKPTAFDLEEIVAIKGDIHDWDDYYRIDAIGYHGDIDLIHSLKNETVESLIDLFPDWRVSTTTFDQDVKIEMQSSIKTYIQSYLKYATRLVNGDYDALIDSPTTSTIVQSLFYFFSNEISVDERFKRIYEFFNSHYFSEIPYQWIASRVFAALKREVKQGEAYKNRAKAISHFSGFLNDVQHISIYAPYCDAFVMDKPMAALLVKAKPYIDLEERYGVKIFSLNNWDQFSIWLDKLESDMSQIHREGLAAAYPLTSTKR